MFGSKKNKAQKVAQAIKCSTLLDNMILKGDIEFTESLRITADVYGNVFSKDNDPDRTELILLDGGEINGNVRVPKAYIDGTVVGNVRANQLKLDKRARIVGDVSYEVLIMEEGASIEGSIKRLNQQQSIGNNIPSSQLPPVSVGQTAQEPLKTSSLEEDSITIPVIDRKIEL